MKRKHRPPARQPHPDGRIELQLQHIIGCQDAIRRYELLIAEYRAHINSASDELDRDGDELRNHPGKSQQAAFDKSASVQQARIKIAAEGITAAEASITAQRDEISKLTAELSDTDLAYL